MDVDVDEVLEAANFAVNDYNEKSIDANLEFQSVEGCCKELGNKSDLIFLKIKVKYGDFDHYMLFTTAVRVPNQVYRSDHPLESVGLFLLSEKFEGIKPKPLEPHLKPVIDFVIERHNSLHDVKLKFVNILEVAEGLSKDHARYYLTLLTHTNDSVDFVYNTCVMKQGEFMESTGLIFLSAYPFPSWISLDLLCNVRMMFREDDYNYPYPIPIYRDDGETINRLKTMANMVGPVGVRDWVMSHLTYIPENVHECVLLGIAEALSMFIPYVGGVEYGYVVLPPLRKLCTIENHFVRGKAVASLHEIGNQMKEKDLLDYFVPLVKGMVVDQFYTARVSSCGLFDILYERAPMNLKMDLNLLYKKLCNDSMPVVRRSAALNFEKFSSIIEPKSDIIPMFKVLTNDDQDYVRLYSIESCTKIIRQLEPQDYVAPVCAVVSQLSQDPFWFVRYMVAKQFCEICEMVPHGYTGVDLLSAFSRLLRDNHTKVRMEAAGKVAKFCRIMNSQDVIRHILPCVVELSCDSSVDVRSALASDIIGMFAVLGKDAAIEQLLAIVRSLLEDISALVQINVFSKLDQVDEVIFNQLSRSLLCAADKLANHKSWTYRRSIIEYIPLLVSRLCQSPEVDNLTILCEWRKENDQDPFVRRAAEKSLNRLAEVREIGIVGNATVVQDS